MTFRRPFRVRLLEQKKRGFLSVSDLARWFERPYSVVWYWTAEDRRTNVADEKDREARLKLLKKAIDEGVSAREYKLVLKHDTPRGGAKVRRGVGRTVPGSEVLYYVGSGCEVRAKPKKR